MAQLDDIKALARLDPDEMARHIRDLPEQIADAAAAYRGLVLPTHYIQAKQILILGMGGSAIGGELAAALAADTSSVPIEVRRDYGVPAHVGKDTLVIGVSYSGGTEETLEGFRQAASRGAKLIAISTGGPLGSLARKFQVPLLSIDYGAQPRAAFGWLLVAVASVLAKLRHFPLGATELAESAVLMKALRGTIDLDVPTAANMAKTLATKLRDRIPFIIGSGIQATVAKRWKTQLNENGKVAAVAEALPELCHNVVVGMERIHKQRDYLYPIFLTSQFSHPRNVLRAAIVAKQFAAGKLPADVITLPTPGTALSEALQMIYLGDYLSLYVAYLANTDPTVIRPIVALKKELDAVAWEPNG